MIAALFVETNGAYFGLSDVDPWDVRRNAMRYDGPHPVVAHPPCARWCRLAGLVEARWGHKRGEDGGMFEHALDCVRRFGGVLEHPAYSDAWARYGLPKPHRGGGWQRGLCGGWSCHVEQGRYGHPAKKATWLYAFGCELPALEWREAFRSEMVAMARSVKWDNRNSDPDARHMPKGMRSKTPALFRDVLVAMAATAEVA
jgi:hypothetical protein